MKKISCLIVALSCLLVLSGCYYGVHKKVSRRFEKDYERNMKIDLETSSGNIDIDNWDRDYIEIRAEINAYAMTEDRAYELAENTEIDFSQRDGKLKIRKTSYTQSVNESVSVDYKLKLPCYFNSDFETNSGDVKVEEAVGDLQIKTSSGDIELEEIGGNVQIDTSSGDLEAEELVGDLTYTSSSGDLEVDYLIGKVTLETSSGDIKGAFDLKEEDNRIDTSSGDVKVKLEGWPSLRVELTTSSGHIDISNLDLKIFEREEEVVEGIIGNGEGKLRIDTSSGDITLSD